MKLRTRLLASVAAGACALVAAGAAHANSCREWRGEHRRWKAEAVHLYLTGAPQRKLDAAVFEVLQREAYLTSCDVSVQAARADLVGWRLVGRPAEEYGSAVVESVLELGGFGLDARRLFPVRPAAVAMDDRRPRFRRRGAR